MATQAAAHRNWWKVGFFAALLAFEITRELFVLEMQREPEPSVLSSIGDFGDYIYARGVWKRIDDGGSLVPTTITIECRLEDHECIEASAAIFDNSVMAPEMDRFPASFTEQAVTYENTSPECVTYAVRIDRKLRKIFSVRQRKPNANGELCKNLEQRIEMQLGEWQPRSGEDLGKGHFLPVLGLLWGIARIFA